MHWCLGIRTHLNALHSLEVTKKKRFKDSNQPFIVDHTLGFLSRHEFAEFAHPGFCVCSIRTSCSYFPSVTWQGRCAQGAGYTVRGEWGGNEWVPQSAWGWYGPWSIMKPNCHGWAEGSVVMHVCAAYVICEPLFDVRTLTGQMYGFKFQFLVCGIAASWLYYQRCRSPIAKGILLRLGVMCLICLAANLLATHLRSWWLDFWFVLRQFYL